MSSLDDNERCMGGSPLDARWEANCRDCLRRWAKETTDTVRILPPLIVEEIEVFPKRVVMEVEEPEETSSDEGLACPYCGYIDRAAWELERDGTSGNAECKSCEREFSFSIETFTTYYGKPLADRKEGE